jgi:hypothetical protein
MMASSGLYPAFPAQGGPSLHFVFNFEPGPMLRPVSALITGRSGCALEVNQSPATHFVVRLPFEMCVMIDLDQRADRLYALN